MNRKHAHSGVRRIGIGLGLAAGALVAAVLADSPVASADGPFDLEPEGPGVVVSDTGIPGLFDEGQITQEIAEYDVATGDPATGVQAGSLDVTENIFTTPLGSVGFVDGADATDGTGVYAGDVGDFGAYSLVFESPSDQVSAFGTLPLSDFDFSDLSSAASALPADDFGLSSLGLEGLAPGLESLLNLF